MSAPTALPPVPRVLRRAWPLAWRIGFASLVGLVVFGAVHTPTLEGTGSRSAATTTLLVLDVLVGPLAIGLLAVRRHPVAAATIVLLSTFSSLSSGAAVVAVVSFTAHQRLRATLVLAVAFSAVTAAAWLVAPDTGGSWWAEVLAASAAFGVLGLVGSSVRNRRQLVASLRAQADAARREQDARAAEARRAERSRIAREMHDALGHRLSIVAMHAGALESRPDLSPGDTRAAAGVVRESAQQAMADLRAVLGVLAEPSSTAAGTDVPSLAQLDAPVAEGVGDGAVPVLRWEADPATVSDTIGRHLYRVAQEALTNVRKHAPGAHTEVTVRSPGPGLVEIVVSSRLPPGPRQGPGSRHGLDGLAERARLAGGTLVAGVHDSRFVVRAVLPCRG